jgi:hypothetical protein
MYAPTPPAVTGTPPAFDPFRGIDFGSLLASPFETAVADFARHHDAMLKRLADQVAGVFDRIAPAVRDALDKGFDGLRREIAAQAEATRSLRDANALVPVAD